MEQSHSAKVQYRSISCLVDFCRELTDDNETAKQVLAPVSQKLLEALYKTIEMNLQSDKPN